MRFDVAVTATAVMMGMASQVTAKTARTYTDMVSEKSLKGVDWLFYAPQNNKTYSDILLSGFYNPPASKDADKQHGDYIDTKYVQISPQYLKNTSTLQLTYKTTSSLGADQVDITTLFIPPNWDHNTVVTYLTAEDSSDPLCAPSVLASSRIGYDQVIQDYLQFGYAVNVPDFEGQAAAFMAAVKAGRSTLDSLNAIVEYGRTQNWFSDPRISITGYSGGATPAVSAIQQLDSYFPGVKSYIKSAAIGGIPGKIYNTFDKVNKSLYTGFILAALIGLAREYPTVADALNKYLWPGSRIAMIPAQIGCQEGVVAAYAWQNAWAYFRDGNSFNASTIDIMNAQNLKAAPVDFPLFLFEASNDQIVDINDMHEIVNDFCKFGAHLKYVEPTIQNAYPHETYFSSMFDAMGWVKGIFEGAPAPATCTDWQSALHN